MKMYSQNGLGRPFGLQFLDGVGDVYENNVNKYGDYENEDKFGQSAQYSDPYASQYKSDDRDISEYTEYTTANAATVHPTCTCCNPTNSNASASAAQSVSVSSNTNAKSVKEIVTDTEFWLGIGIGAFAFWGISRIAKKSKKNDKSKE